MKILPFIFCLIGAFLVSPDLGEIRKNYPSANDSKEVTQKMYDALSEISKDNKAILVAYKGGISTIMAKHSKGIKDKKTYFKEGVSLLEHAVEQDNDNIEIRCIRLGVQENSPKFLKYKDAIADDKKFILEHFKSTESQEIKAFIKGFALQSELFDDQEKQLF